MRPTVVCAILLLCAGCVGRGQDAHEPGDRLGTFHASGALTSDTCQAPILGVTSTWAFDVKLSREGSTIYWLNGEEAIPGNIAADGVSFGFVSGVDVPLQAAQGAQLGCTISRADSASGVLSSSSTTDVASFSVNMSFAYAAEVGSQCAGWVGVQGGFATLPCRVSYSLTAQRTALPTAIDD
jgi:hypothetical protein